MSDRNFLKECTPEPQWAAHREISQRTSARYRQQGLPYLEFGGRIYIPPEGDEWIRSRICRPERSRGRDQRSEKSVRARRAAAA